MEDLDEYEFDNSRPASKAGNLVENDEMFDWIENQGYRRTRDKEGATFTKLGKAWLITVTGAQYLHHDRHVKTLDMSNDTWMVVGYSDDDQILLTEFDDRTFEHFKLDRGHMIYLNTANLHLVSRTNANSQVFFLQVEGFGPDQEQEAYEAMCDIFDGYKSGAIAFAKS